MNNREEITMINQQQNNGPNQQFWYTQRKRIEDIWSRSKYISPNRNWSNWFSAKNKSLEQRGEAYRVGPEYGVIATSWLDFEGYGVDVARTISENEIGVYKVEKPNSPTISLEQALGIFVEKEREQRTEYERT